MHGEGWLLLERWTLEKQKLFFEEIFDVPLKVLN